MGSVAVASGRGPADGRGALMWHCGSEGVRACICGSGGQWSLLVGAGQGGGGVVVTRVRVVGGARWARF